MDDRTRGRRRARWATGTLVALSLTGTIGVGAAVAGHSTPVATASPAATSTPATGSTTAAAAPTVTAGSGSASATTSGS